MAPIEHLIEEISGNDLNTDYANRVTILREAYKKQNLGAYFSIHKDGHWNGNTFDENWGNFEDSTEWDNSWDQGAPHK